MAKEVTATLVVGFSEGIATTGSRGILSLRVDDRIDGSNGGNTDFNPGESVGYLLYNSTKVSGIQNFSNLGTPQLLTTGSEQRVETVIFANTNKATLQFPITGGVGVNWIGADGGPITIEDEKDIVLANKFVGVAEITYTASFKVFQIINMPSLVNNKNNFTLIIVATGNVN